MNVWWFIVGILIGGWVENALMKVEISKSIIVQQEMSLQQCVVPPPPKGLSPLEQQRLLVKDCWFRDCELVPWHMLDVSMAENGHLRRDKWH